MSAMSFAGHPADDELLGCVDDDAAADTRAHVEACEACSARVAELRQRQDRIHHALEAMDGTVAGALPQSFAELRARRGGDVHQLPVRRSAWRNGRLAAAAVLLLAFLGVMASPIRARVLEWFGGARAPETMIVDSSASAAEIPGTSVQEEGEIRFTPKGEELVLSFATAQPGSTLQLRRGRDSGRLQLRNVGGSDPAVTLLPSEVRIDNHAHADAQFAIEVPSHVRTVLIRIGNAAVRMSMQTLPAEGMEMRLVPESAPGRAWER